MDLWAFVNKYKTSESKNANLTSIKGGKWNIPNKEYKKLYKLIRQEIKKNIPLPPITESIGDILPLIFDIDIKYLENVTDRQYNTVFIKHVY